MCLISHRLRTFSLLQNYPKLKSNNCWCHHSLLIHPGENTRWISPISVFMCMCSYNVDSYIDPFMHYICNSKYLASYTLVYNLIVPLNLLLVYRIISMLVQFYGFLLPICLSVFRLYIHIHKPPPSLSLPLNSISSHFLFFFFQSWIHDHGFSITISRCCLPSFIFFLLVHGRSLTQALHYTNSFALLYHES